MQTAEFRDAVYRIVCDAPEPITPREIGEKLGVSQEYVNNCLRKQLLCTRVVRHKAARNGIPFVYWPRHKPWPADVPLYDGVTKRARRDAARKRAKMLTAQELNERRLRGARRGSEEGNAEKRLKMRQSERFPDPRFANGAYDRSPLTDTEKARLWSWANR